MYIYLNVSPILITQLNVPSCTSALFSSDVICCHFNISTDFYSTFNATSLTKTVSSDVPQLRSAWLKQPHSSSLRTTPQNEEVIFKTKEGEKNTYCRLVTHTASLGLLRRFHTRSGCQTAGAWSTNSFAPGKRQPFPVEWNRRCLVNFSLFMVSLHEEIKSEPPVWWNKGNGGKHNLSTVLFM